MALSLYEILFYYSNRYQMNRSELEALWAVDQERLYADTLPEWRLGDTVLLFENKWPDNLEIHPAYADAFKKAKLLATAKDLTTNLLSPEKKVLVEEKNN